MVRRSIQGGDPTRPNGLFFSQGKRYQVIGNSFYEDLTKVGVTVSATSALRWANTSTQIGFVDGGTVYVYTPSTGAYTSVSSLFLNDPGDICVLNGRAIVIRKNNNVFFVSEQGNIQNYDANRFAIFQAMGDLLMGCASFKSRLFLFGRFSTEIWNPVPVAGVPFQRDPNFVFEWGTPSTHSIIKGQDSAADTVLSWLAQDKSGSPSFLLTYGTDIETISTAPISILLQSFSSLSDCVGKYYKIDGHAFLEWDFASANYTLTYDSTMKKWSTREMLDGSRFIGNSHCFDGTTHYMGSRSDSTLWKLSPDYLTYGDENIHRSRTSAILHSPSLNRRTVNKFEIKFQTAYMPVDLNPTAYLSTSIDYQPYGSARQQQLGAIGAYRYKTQWYGFGTGYAFCFRLDLYEQFKTFIIGASIDDTEFGS